MKRPSLPRFWNRPATQCGFTLVELQLSAALTLGVVLMGGIGLTRMLTVSSRAEAQQARQANNNRALEFIGTEARQVRYVMPFEAGKDAKDCTKAELVKTYNPEDADALIKEINALPGKITQCQPVVQMFLPRASGGLIFRPILYFLASTEGAPWQGPKVLYRWGPDLNEKGEFEDPQDIKTWSVAPLMDGIDSSSSTELTPNMPECPSGWIASPSQKDSPRKLHNATGFYACIDDGDRTAQLFLKGKVNKGKSVIASTKFFTRSVESPSSSTNPPATNPPATNPPATNPPATNPPATNPPATNPPATNPPATNPPATQCPPGLAKKDKC